MASSAGHGGARLSRVSQHTQLHCKSCDGWLCCLRGALHIMCLCLVPVELVKVRCRAFAVARV